MKYKRDVALTDAGAYTETKKHDTYKTKIIAMTVIPAMLLMPFLVPLYILIGLNGDGHGNPIGMSYRFESLSMYWGQIVDLLTRQINLFVFFKNTIVFYLPAGLIKAPLPLYNMGDVQWNVRFPFFAIVAIWAMVPFFAGYSMVKKNPYRRTPNIYGDSRWAVESDIASMAKMNLIGFESVKFKLFVIGRLPPKKKKIFPLLRMGETLSVLLLAPPGTGKTAGFIVPSAVLMDEACLFLHDQKPELFDITSGHRATVGPVFQLKWSAQDAPDGSVMNSEQIKRISPDLLVKDESGEPVRNEDGDYLTKPIFYPSWNPLSPKSMPAAGKRDLYIDRLVNVLCPPPKGGDAFWADKARVALLGMIHFLVGKVDYATHPLIQGGWDGIPDHWHGKEPSFPMLIDWYSYIQTLYEDQGDDPMRMVFKRCIDEARLMEEKLEQVYGTRVLNRAIVEMTSLMNAGDKTRSSILQTMDAALNSFKSAAVAQRTSTSNFAFNELRGMPIPAAKAREEQRALDALKNGKIYKPRYTKNEYRPVTVYISIPAEDAKTFSTLTGIFVDSANAYLVANGPNQIDDQGNQNGPYPFGFLLDEAPQLPKLDTVINGPAVGRSKKVFYIIVGQDLGQFADKYSRDDVGSIKSITAIKLILAQNNDESAKQLAGMSGKMTVVKHNYSEKAAPGGGQNKGVAGALEGIVKGVGGKAMSSSESFEGVDFLKPDQIMSLPKGKHIALVQNFMNRPLMLDTPFFFLDDDLRTKTYNMEEAKGLYPTTPMPVLDIEAALEEWKLFKVKNQGNMDRKSRLLEPRVVVVVSPEDIASLKQSEFGDMPSQNNTWTFGVVKIHPPSMDFDHVEDTHLKEGEEHDPDAILTTSNPEEAAALLQDGRTLLFDRATLSHLNDWLTQAGQKPVHDDLAIFLDERASEIGEDAKGSLYTLGYDTSVRLDPITDPDTVDPKMALLYMTSIMTFIIGVEVQQTMFAD